MNAAAIQQQISDLMSNGQHARARDVLMRLLPKNVGNPSILDALAVVHLHMGEHDRALFFSGSAVAAGPRAAQFLITHSNVLSAISRREESVKAAERAVALEPSNAQALSALSVSQREVGQYASAAESGRRALLAAPEDDLIRANLASLLIYMGKPREAIELAAQLPRSASGALIRIAAATASNYLDNCPPSEIAALHQDAGRHIRPAVAEPFVRPPARPVGRMRIGVMSADLRRHSVASFAAALLQGHDRRAMDLIVFNTGLVRDEETRRLMALGGNWKSCGALPDEMLTRKIREEHLDALIDLHGLSAGHRMGVCAARCAPVQMTYCGYPNTTGLPAMDVRLVDNITDPESADGVCSERLIRLERCFLCYSPPAEALEIDLKAKAPTQEQRPLTFGSFNAFQKISDRTIALWARALRRHSGSRMLLKAGAFKDAELVQNVTDRFALHDIGADRLDIRPPVTGLAGHLAAYNSMDVALDTWPYNGTTTTCEALIMGVPVVTRTGATHASRVGASVLTAAGCDSWIAHDDAMWEAAIDRAVADVRGAGWSGHDLRQKVLRSSLCDTQGWNDAFLIALKSVCLAG